MELKYIIPIFALCLTLQLTTMKDQLVFVYGTLKKGGWNHRLLRNSNFIDYAKTVEPFYMVNLNGPTGFPFVVSGDLRSDDYKGSVLGEVYSVDELTLKKLDALEGYPNLYLREKFDLKLTTDGTSVSAFMYFQNASYFRLYHTLRYVVSRDWQNDTPNTLIYELNG